MSIKTEQAPKPSPDTTICYEESTRLSPELLRETLDNFKPGDVWAVDPELLNASKKVLTNNSKKFSWWLF